MAAMKIELTRTLKVALLEAVKTGTLDMAIFDDERPEQAQSIEDIEREIVRLEMFQDKAYLLELSELMRAYASNEITKDAYLTERIKLITTK